VTVLVYGLAVAGASTARALRQRDIDVVVVDDAVDDERLALAAALDVELLGPMEDRALERLVGSCELVSPAPGIPETHAVIAAARTRGVELVSEIELAYRWEQERAGGPRPMLAITGTDGKTTTTLLTVDILRAAGLRTVDAGNTSTPLVDAIDQDLDAFVVECTSFRLAWTPTFRAEAAAWLNLAPDHLNWHASMASYEAAKARIFANQRTSDTAIGLANDPIVTRNVAAAPGRKISFGLDEGDYRSLISDGDRVLTGPHGDIVSASAMSRALPHDITNALAASALVLESGLADVGAIRRAVASFVGPRHRLEHVATRSGVAWFNDSKATTPHAASAAIRSFDRIILIAGGYDKGVDLSPMAAEPQRLSTVLAIGNTGPQLADAFRRAGGPGSIEVLPDLVAAVERASAVAAPGDTVLLSPGCASFDQYPNFEARGEHFRSLVEALDPAPTTSSQQHQPNSQPNRQPNSSVNTDPNPSRKDIRA
jgi:UDP-N-acetylmuramoylalanine--D-glutamate ligase